MIRQVASDSGIRPVRVIVGDLDAVAVQRLRRVLHQEAGVPGTRLEVDLAAVDDRHPLSMFALLSETVNRCLADGSELVVLLPPAAMLTSLRAVGIRIQHGPLMPAARGQVVHVGIPRTDRESRDAEARPSLIEAPTASATPLV